MSALVDSSGWLEYFEDGANAGFFAPAIEQTSALVVPTICLYEVFKRLLLVRGEEAALQAAAFMMQGAVVDLTQPVALAAARISSELKLAMADSLILATAREHGATLWTQDEHFASLPEVQFVRK